MESALQAGNMSLITLRPSCSRAKKRLRRVGSSLYEKPVAPESPPRKHMNWAAEKKKKEMEAVSKEMGARGMVVQSL